MNGFRTLATRFRQIAPDGTVSHGDILIRRPGRMRIRFDDRDMTILTSDRWLIVVDGRYGEPQNFPLNSTPAGILVRNEIRFGRDIRATGLRRTGERIFVTVVRPESPRSGRMILEFERGTLDLAGWTVIDAQGQKTRVFLSDTRFGLPLASSLFEPPPPPAAPAGPGSDR